MPITFPCRCGTTLQVAEEHAGMQVECPTCQSEVTAPAATAKAPPPAAPLPVARRATRPAAPESDFEVLDDGDAGRPRRPRPTAEDDDDRPRRKKPAKVKHKPRSLEGRVLNGGVLGGLLAVVIAVVWFVAGLAADRIFFYPPILLIIGLVGIVKGLAGGGGDDAGGDDGGDGD